MTRDRITGRTAPTPRFGIARVTLHIVQGYLAEDVTVAVAEDDYTCTPKCKRGSANDVRFVPNATEAAHGMCQERA
jgi:hypothetical protein